MPMVKAARCKIRKGLIRMLKWRLILMSLVITFVFIFTGQSAQADWTVYGEVGDPGYVTEYYGDKITSEYRRGYQADDWTERGDSSVTDSPIFEDGIRLTAWASRHEDDYNYALASAIYFFDVPSSARSIKIKVHYDGEVYRDDFDENIAGRIWIKRTSVGDEFEEYSPREGRYEDAERPLYGDTYVLRARKSFEIIRISADDHVADGVMELHVVTEGGQRIDVKYIEVETYSYMPRVRVVTKYYRDYTWRPWYDYTYWYFYTGPTYHFSDYYYVRYTYPDYRTHYVEIRKRYHNYLTVSYVRHPRYRMDVDRVNVVHTYRGPHREWDRANLNRWTSNHDEARKNYTVISTAKTRLTDVQKSRERVRSVLASHNRTSPAVRAEASRTVPKRADTSVQTRSSATEVKRRSETSSVSSGVRRDSERNSASRVQSSRSQNLERAPAQSETRSETKTRTEVRSSVRTRSSSSDQDKQNAQDREVKRSPTRSSVREQQNTSSGSEQSKLRRGSDRSQTPESKGSSDVRKAPSRSESREQPPAKKVETKVETKKDDDDKDKDKDEEEKKKSESASSSVKSSSSSSGKVRRSETRSSSR